MTTAIFGPGGFGRELLPLVTGEVVFISDDPEQVGSRVEDVEVISLEEFRRRGQGSSTSEPGRVAISVADASIRRRIASRIDDLPAATLIAQSAVIGPGVTIAEGAILCAFTTITASATIGRHFHANIYSYVAHDCVVGDFVTLAPRVCINGNTIIEDDVYIGTGAVLRQGTPDKPLRIGKGALIGMGAVVTKDVEPGAVMIGNPARPKS